MASQPFQAALHTGARAACCLFVAFLLAGCGAGAGSGNGGSDISVTIANKVSSIQADTAAVVFEATVQNDSSNSGVTWSLTANGVACSPACGTLSQATGTTVTYLPPNTAPVTPANQPILTATSVTKTSKSDSDPFAITAALMVTISNKFTVVKTGASPFVVNATVQNDSTNSGVTWTLTANGSPCSPACGNLSGITRSNVTYLPPASPKASQPVLKAISLHDSTKSDTDSFSVQAASISVAIDAKIATAYAGGSQIVFAANVQNDPSNSAANWILTANGSPCSPACGSLIGPYLGELGVVYASPGSVPAPPDNQPTVTAVSGADSSKFDSDVFTIVPQPPIAVTITQISSVLANANGGVNFSANVQNDFSSPPQGVTWTLTSGTPPSACSPACGSLSNPLALSVTYTPPSSVPASPNNQPTLTATSVADNTKTGSNTFNINSSVVNGCGSAGGSESLLSGHYALLMEGFAGNTGTPYQVAASFGADGTGGVTGGDEDINDMISPQHLTLSSIGSLYTVGSDHRGCLQVTNTGGTTIIFHFALGTISGALASNGRIIEFDDSSGSGNRGSGILRLQDPNSFVLSALQSQYAFGVAGWGTQNGQYVRISAAGGFNDDSDGNLSNGVDDLNFAGSLFLDATGLFGNIDPISATGRATASFDLFDWAIYVVNSSEFFLLDTDSMQNGNPSIGRAIATGNAFNASALTGNYIVHAAGNANGSADVTLDLLTMVPGGAQAGTLSETVYSYGAGNGAQASSLAGVTYNIDPTLGRTTLGNPDDNLPIMYVTTPTDGIAAFVMGVGPDGLSGIAEVQTNPAFAAGRYIFGTEVPAANTVANKVGIETISSAGALSGTYDQSDTSGLLTGQMVSATVSLGANGTGNAGANTIAITTGSKLFTINETRGAAAAIVLAEQ